jgi:membrane protein involved in colicin uptake
MSKYTDEEVYESLRAQVDACEKTETEAMAEWSQYRETRLLAQGIVEAARLSDIARRADAKAEAKAEAKAKVEAKAEAEANIASDRDEFLTRLGCDPEDPYSWGFLTSSAEVMVAVKAEARSLGFVSIFENIISGNNEFGQDEVVEADYRLFYVKWQAPRGKKKNKQKED